MNNDKLLIIVVVLTLYLLCFRRSEGQETGDDYVCEFDKTKIQETVAEMLGSDGIDDEGKIKTVNLEHGLVVNNKEFVDSGAGRNSGNSFIISLKTPARSDTSLFAGSNNLLWSSKDKEFPHQFNQI